MPMYVAQSPEKFIDEQDSHPVERIEPQGSRFDTIEVKLGDTNITLKAQEVGTSRISTHTFSAANELYAGVHPSDGLARDLDQDIKDTLQLLGYVAVERQSDLREC